MQRILIAFLVVLGCNRGAEATVRDGTILAPYLAIGDKLANDSIDGLDPFATSLVATAEPLQSVPGVAAVLAGARRVSAQDIATARAAYRTMSDGVIQYLQARPDQRQGLVLVHCTMTFEGQGAHWVQRQGTVMNPYEGAAMPHCGDVVAW